MLWPEPSQWASGPRLREKKPGKWNPKSASRQDSEACLGHVFVYRLQFQDVLQRPCLTMYHLMILASYLQGHKMISIDVCRNLKTHPCSTGLAEAAHLSIKS
ncbi:hypothetical protein AcW1_002934 [Taiwanofungus camphoratus]|nr:hypothetical protein AcW1_002934 [Antrodia cinnamomea]